MTEDAQRLVDYCQEKNRICPTPRKWNRLWKILCRLGDEAETGRPPISLILNGWMVSSDREKRLCLEEQIEWADAHGNLDKVSTFLHAVTKEEWHVAGPRDLDWTYDLPESEEEDSDD